MHSSIKSSLLGKSFYLFIIGILFLGMVAAQGKGQSGPSGNRGLQSPVTKQIFEVTGIVDSVHLGFGQGSPAMEIDSSGTIHAIVLAPYSYLSEQGFELEAGDEVTALVFQSLVYPDWLVAVEVENHTKEVSVAMRDESGIPLWRSSRVGRRQGSGTQGLRQCDGTGPNVESAQFLNGEVADIDSQLGQQNPSIVLVSGETIMVGPYRVWQETGFELEVGQSVSVYAFPSFSNPGLWVAISIENLNTSETLVLRDDTGIPVTGKGWPSKGNCNGTCRGGR